MQQNTTVNLQKVVTHSQMLMCQKREYVHNAA